MADKTTISWTQATWNPTTGCSHVSEGCRFCYAEALSLRYGWTQKRWTQPNAAENVVCHPDRLDIPLHWKKPRRVFVNSMSDLFHEQVPDLFIKQVVATMTVTPWHTYQILTKRPARMLAFYTHAQPWPTLVLPNVWLGVSVEEQRAADERIPLLLQTPAAVRFVSAEPLLGPIDLSKCLTRRTEVSFPISAFGAARETTWPGLNWIIVGGESGPRHRPMDLEWARSLRDQCVKAKVPFYYKQGSHRLPGRDILLDGVEWHQYPEVKP